MLSLLVAQLPVSRSEASCNQIPGTSNNFRGSGGSLDRPFAAPGDRVTVRLSPACDARSPGFDGEASPVVSIVFTPPAGARNVVVLAASCTALEDQRRQCEGRDDVDRAICIPSSAADGGLQVLDKHQLRFTFPDTDTLLGGPFDDRTLAGPATVAVTSAGEALPCDLAARPCRGHDNLRACVDALFTLDGTCGTVTDTTFGHFTALPPANNYQALCTSPVPPCTGSARELRFALDAAGNILIPMDWRGILPAGSVPIGRQLRTTFAGPAFAGGDQPIRLPGSAFLSSYSPEGGLLPPIFEPQTDPTARGELVLFGTADAASTVLRLARRSPLLRQCAGGADDSQPCTEDAQCSGGSCGRGTCQGGASSGSTCRSDAECGDSECSTSTFDFRSRRLDGGGPVVIPRFGPGVCQDSGEPCVDDGPCVDSRCVTYRISAHEAIPLEGLIESESLLVSFVPEAIDGRDLNGDGDVADDAVLLTDRKTGGRNVIGRNGAPGKAGTRLRQLPFSYPAVTVVGDLLAFLEAEPLQGQSDLNGDGDRFDTILRVFRSDAAMTQELSAGLDLAIDAAPKINGRSLVISDSLVFFRRAEAAAAPRRIRRASINQQGQSADHHAQRPSLSKDGRHVAFESRASNLVPALSSGALTSYVHDRNSGSTTRVELNSDVLPDGAATRTPWLSGDGRFVTISALAHNGYRQIFVYDRDRDGNGIFDEMGQTSTALISRHSDDMGGEKAAELGDSTLPSLSPDGRFVAYSTASPYLDPRIVAFRGAVIRSDRDPRGTGIFDEASFAETNQLVTRLVAEEAGHHAALQVTALSADGRYLAFTSFDRNLPPLDLNDFCLNLGVSGANAVTCPDILLHDMLSHEMRLVSVSSNAEQSNNQSLSPALSSSAEVVAFESAATNLVAGDTNDVVDVFVHERSAATTSRVSVSSASEQGNASSFGRTLSLSDDGRFVAFASRADNLVADDTNVACASASGDGIENCSDIFVHDRLTGFTERVSRTPDAEGNHASGWPSLSADGSTVAFESRATNLTAGAASCSDGPCTAILVAEPQALPGLDRNGDGDIADSILEVFDAAHPERGPSALGPALDVAVAAGRALFLVPEVQAGADLNGDGDLEDRIANLYADSVVTNLRRAADAVSLSATLAAVRVSEAHDQEQDLNGDGDSDDSVLAVYSLAAGSWTNLGIAVDEVVSSGDFVIAAAVERQQDEDLNGDGDRDDRVLHIYTAATGSTTSIAQAVDDLVVDRHVVAFRTSEVRQGGVDLNGDGDISDAVLQVYDMDTKQLTSSAQAAIPCRLAACDPRFPYRVVGNAVKFLTLEAEQGEDLNDDGDEADLVLQTFQLPVARAILSHSRRGAGDRIAQMRASRTHRRAGALQAGALTAIGAVSAGVCTDSGRACATATDCGSGARCFVPPGNCIEKLSRICDTALANGTCGPEAFCVPSGAPGKGTCHARRGPCAGDSDCTAPARCQDAGDSFQRLVSPLAPDTANHVFLAACDAASPLCAAPLLVAAAADEDRDGITDPFDNCPRRANPDQSDSDGDGIGDTCARSADTPSPTPTHTTPPTPTPSTSRQGSGGDGCQTTSIPTSSWSTLLAFLGVCLVARRQCRPSPSAKALLIVLTILTPYGARATERCPGDCDGSGLVDVTDLLQLANADCTLPADSTTAGSSVHQGVRAIASVLTGCRPGATIEPVALGSLLFVLSRLPLLELLYAAAIGGSGGSNMCEQGGRHDTSCEADLGEQIRILLSAENCAGSTAEGAGHLHGSITLLGAGLCPHIIVPSSMALDFAMSSRVDDRSGRPLLSTTVHAVSSLDGFLFDRPPCRIRGGSGRLNGSVTFSTDGHERELIAENLSLSFRIGQFQLMPICDPGFITADLDGTLWIRDPSTAASLPVSARGLRVTRHRLTNTIEIDGTLVADALGGEVVLRTVEPLRSTLDAPCPTAGTLALTAHAATRELQMGTDGWNCSP